jgi:GH15 family glucan-1,4-alpha-glucosidase
MSNRIEDYALIGDCETAALVCRSGSIDWLCWPRFDSAACFAALLGTPEHGRWLLAPADPAARIHRRYRDGTLVLETLFETATGNVELLDFMPPRGSNSDLVRIVTGRSGQVGMRMELVLRFGYGQVVPWVTHLPEDGGVRAIAGPDMVVLHSPVETRGADLRTLAEFTVSAGQSLPFTLTYGPSHLPQPQPIDPVAALRDTEVYWREFSGGCAPAGRWTEAVRRSLITLKALTYRPTGGIVAAPTTSLPERLGGQRNWDYRYCWLRDATLTLMAQLQGGYLEDARAWRDWLLRAVAGSPDQIQIMYGLAGERRLPEFELDWLPGYEGSRPVRVGNAAHEQLQLDVFGEVMDAMHQAHRRGIEFSDEGWALQRALLLHLETVWREPDYGIWEVRGGPQQFTYSKVMAWAAVDRGVRDIEAFGRQGPLERWRELRRRIHEDVCRHGFDPGLNSFTRAYGSGDLDASLLLLPSIGFLPARDPRMLGTVAAIERHLIDAHGFVKRYDTDRSHDGLPPGEGAFLACSFWLANIYLAQGRRADAEWLFERLLAIRNDLGLLAEEYDAGSGRMVGNFPQAFSHVALVDTAYLLSKDGGAHERKGAPAGPDVEARRAD